MNIKQPDVVFPPTEETALKLKSAFQNSSELSHNEKFKLVWAEMERLMSPRLLKMHKDAEISLNNADCSNTYLDECIANDQKVAEFVNDPEYAAVYDHVTAALGDMALRF